MSRRSRPLDVAIVGMACRFAGATNLFQFWQNVLEGRTSISEVPSHRWDANTFYDPESSASDRVKGRRGGYLDEPILMDPGSLGVMPRTLEGGEPEQFLVLDAARSALSDAGYPEGVQDGRRVEVVIGRGNYFNRGNLTRLQHGRVLAQTLAILNALHPEWSDADRDAVRSELKRTLPPFESATIPGQITNATAGRVSHRLGLTGASYVVDAASASALVALDLGANALRSKRADLVIVGGVYIEADVDFPMVFSQLGVLSRSGESRPFAEDADGLVPGEGVGVLVLKRLRDAERNRDRIYAVLKGVGLSSDGRGRGLASPDAKGHVRAIRRAYRQSSVEPASVELIEGHGLGVPAADRAELKALYAVFPPTESGTTRVLGAASALIGHPMPAAGMAGVIKAALALHHRVLPASPDVGEPHALLRKAEDRFERNPTSRPWIQGGKTPRRAGVNAFGFAGINGHAVLEAHPSSDHQVPGALLRWPDETILIAEPNRNAMVDRVRTLARQLRRRSDWDLKDLAATLNAEAVHSGHASRLGMVVENVDALIDRLESIGERLSDPNRESIRDTKGAYYWERPLGREGGLAFLFPGEGSQYPGMLADLCMHFPEVRIPFDRIDRMAHDSGSIEPPSGRLFRQDRQDDAGLWETSTAVHIVLAAQWAIYQLLLRLGLRPDALCGHSSGEFPALVAAGVIADDDQLEGRFNDLASVFSELERSGVIPEARMIGVATHRERIERIVKENAIPMAIAVDNCPHQVLLVGAPQVARTMADRLKAEGIGCEELPFTRAYHTEVFSAALAPIRAFFESIPMRSPEVPVYSCCVAGRFPDSVQKARHLAIAQWTKPVEFRQTVETMYADGLRLFVDVGGRGNLAAFVEDTLRGRPSFAVAANVPRRSGITQLNHLVASLFAQGVSIDPKVLTSRRRPQHVDLDQEVQTPAPRVALRLGFPEMQLSDELASALRGQQEPKEIELPLSNLSDFSDLSNRLMFEMSEPTPFSHQSGDVDGHLCDDDAIRSYFRTMNSFLETQKRVLSCALNSEMLPPLRGEVDLLENGAVQVDRAAHQADGDESPRTTEQNERGGLPITTANGVPVSRNGIIEPSGERAEWVEWRVLDAMKDPVAEHHTFGGRRISAVDPGMKGLPVLPFTIMAEMLAHAAANHAGNGVLIGLRDVRARRWIRYEEVPIRLEIRISKIPNTLNSFHAALFDRGPVDGPARDLDRPEVEALLDFGARRSDPPPPRPFDLGEHATPTRFTAESIYSEQWLFHGPALQAVVGIGDASNQGIEGVLRVLPLRAIQEDPTAPPPLTNPIVLDAFTHLLGCWGLDQLPEGDVIFPLRLGSLRIFGHDPVEGTDLVCRIAVKEIDRLRVMVDAEILLPDGRVWMQLDDWEDWRFYWPPRYRDVFRQPDRELLGEALELPELGSDSVAVWLQPPEDMGKPIWRDVLEYVQLSPEERAGCLQPSGPEERRTLRLWGRIAAKETVRRLWLRDGRPPEYPADLTIEPDSYGRPWIRSRRTPDHGDLPALSIAHTQGVAVALANRSPHAIVGIDVERVVPRSASFEELAFTDQERRLLDQIGRDGRSAWIARFWCAKEAVGKVTGRGMVAGPSSAEVVAVDAQNGWITVRLNTDLAELRPDLADEPFRVGTAIRDNYAIAWFSRAECRR
ncbi:type I polyketide synthase [Tautonia marina]|uniref:type I polyketide synthase n=1 Tax=Tautonia marina TaxID=2653855 RepID=UPI001260FE79|nr:type I polyketide synthase [Tautonia marina]